MSVYGEGLYRDARGNLHQHAARTVTQVERGEWDPVAPDGGPLTPLPTPETKTPALSSVYALTKFDQERLCLIFGAAYGIPTVALRFFNVYGPRQALSNPYTGVLAIFAARLDASAGAKPPKDAKTRLQELMHARGKPLPEYRVVATHGAPHERSFEVECLADGRSTRGSGTSRQRAEQEAARAMLARLER